MEMLMSINKEFLMRTPSEVSPEQSNPQMLEIRSQLAKNLVHMNSTVVESIYTGVHTANNDIVDTIAAAVKMATNATIEEIELVAQICPSGHDLGDYPFFEDGELNSAFDASYVEAVNS